MLTQEELERERYETREKAKRDRLSWERAHACELERAQQEIERASQTLIRQIQMCEQLLRQPVSSDDQLQAKSLPELEILADQLREKLLG